MSKYFKSLEETYKKASNYKISKETKESSREELEHAFEAANETIANYTEVVDSILFSIRNNETTLEEIKQYIEENDKYMMIYSRYGEI